MIQEDKYHTKEVQSECLKLMKTIHSFLEENGVRYSLACGTLLGAIRHNGFIPWDDDIDIMMDRENFVKFLACKEKLESLSVIRELWVYRIKDKASSKASVDIFVMDKAPKNRLFSKIKVFIIKILQGMLKKNIDYSRYSFPYKVCLIFTSIIGKLFSDDLKFSFYDRVSQIYGKKSEGLAGYNNLFKLLNMRYKQNLLDYLVLHKFEDTDFYITSEYDSYLTIQYGDYMTPPPETDRKPLHI